jgi:GT2 family glycosyltransferase
MPPRTKQTPPELVEERRRAPRTRGARASRPPEPTPVDVVAVLVAHDGAEWLPEALAALAASTCTPAKVVCVDTGSTDGSAELMEAAYGEVLRLPRETGYGEAVARALDGAPLSTWLWLLHDDVAVEPTTLGALLAYAETSPSAALLGPKVRDWYDQRFLVEIGFTSDAAGHRETGLERREYDQGQHDAVRDVLAVGTAAALVRREVWDAVGGLDPELTVFRDDLDLGWKVNAVGHRVVVVPASRVRHVRAATTGHRETDAAPGRAGGVDRRHALYVLVAHAGGLRLATLLPGLLVATVLRSLTLLLTRQPGAAADEWAALLALLSHPGRVHRARRQRAATRVVSQRALRPLFASRAVRIRTRLAAVAGMLSGGSAEGTSTGLLGDPGPDGADAFDDFDAGGPGVLRSLLLRPGVLLFLGLSVVSLLAERSVLALHKGVLHGGALLAAPAGASDLWASYLASWHDVSVGSSGATPPSTAVLALLSTLTLGKPWFAVDLLLLGSVPLGGLAAYLAACRLVRHRSLRVWAALTWALLPVATGAVAGGRLDAAVVQIALPVLALAIAWVLTEDPGTHGWWRVWALGLGLSVTAALVPLLWPLAVVVLLGAALLLVRRPGGRSRALAALVVAALPGVVLMPWSLEVLRHPAVLLVTQQPAEADLDAWRLLLLSPGGPGVPAALVGLGLLLAALGGLLRERFRGLAVAAWLVGLVGLVAAGVLARVEVGGHAVWPGIALQLTGLALVVAALVAGNGVRARLAGHSFGWRQLFAAAVALLAAAMPVVTALSWVVQGADGPLRRDARQLLPAFAQAELQATPGLRALALVPRSDGRIGYELLHGIAPGLEVAGLRVSGDQRARLDAVVADLLSPRGSDAAEALSTRAVRYVALRPGPGRDAAVAALDAQPGLVRRTAGEVDVWRVVAPAARLSVLPSALAQPARSGERAPSARALRVTPPRVLAAGEVGADVVVPAGEPGRLLVLADARADGWRATIDGERLAPRTAWGWAQAFELPATGGTLHLQHRGGGRRAALVVQLVVVVAVAVLAAPGGRRRRGLEDDVEEDDAVDSGNGTRLPVAAL